MEKLETFLKDFGAIKFYPNDLDFESYRHKLNKEDRIKLGNEDDELNNALNINNTSNINSMYNKLYTWQKDAYNECKIFFESIDKAGLIIAPTGSGKSVIKKRNRNIIGSFF